MDLSLELGKGIEELLADGPVVEIRNILLKDPRQLAVARVLVRLEAVVERVGPVAADAGGDHARDEVAHAGDEGVADGGAVGGGGG